ncbi:MAG: hypothetical protein P8R42_23880 [Candidatus Binatia bacterium]|nr:hypothetical protein [Candidatus Binatia bacterium]
MVEDGPGNLIHIVSEGDTLDGAVVQDLSMRFMWSLSGTRLAFSADLELSPPGPTFEASYIANLADSPITFTRVIAEGDTLPDGTEAAGVSAPVIAGLAFASDMDEDSTWPGIFFNENFLNPSSATLPISEATSVPAAPGYTIIYADSDLAIQETAAGNAILAAEVTLCPDADVDGGGGCDVATDNAVVTVQGGVISTRADTISSINPSSGTVFTDLDEPGLFDGAVAFKGAYDDTLGDGVEGIYTDCSGALTKVFDASDPVPGLPGYSFESEGFALQVGFDQNITNQVDFESSLGDGFEMIVSAHPDGTLTDCANTVSTTNPATGEVFEDLNDAAVDGTSIAFWAEDTSAAVGLFTGTCGTLPASGCSTVPLTITRATLWADGSKPGSVTYQGTVEGIDPSSGLTFTVTDGLTTNQSGSVGPGDCVLQNSGTTKCVFKDPVVNKKKVKAVFRPTGNPGEYSFKLQMNKLSIPRPQAGPASLTIVETGGGSFAGSIASCDIGTKKLVCKN